MSSSNVHITNSRRIHGRLKTKPQVIPLSLLDATTAKFALTSAIWLFERPGRRSNQGFSLTQHLGDTLSTTLAAYPQWTGQIKAITTTDGSVPDEAAHLPPHARRFGRIYSQFGFEQDPGVAFSTAVSSVTLDDLHPVCRASEHAIWYMEGRELSRFVAKDAIADPFNANEQDIDGLLKPILAIQLTELSCGGFVLAVKVAHPLADITSLARFMKDWGSVSRPILLCEYEPALRPVFDPSRLDDKAAGDINAVNPDVEIIKQAEQLPLHRYDWWASASSCPWPTSIPQVFQNDHLLPAGKPMPWTEWDVSASVSRCIIHFTRKQVETLWTTANRANTSRVSRHDAILAHIWSCIVRARKIEDSAMVHCDLVYGVRPALELDTDFVGSPMFMINVEMAASNASGPDNDGHSPNLGHIASRIRETIRAVAQQSRIAAHLHSVAYEKSPQRIWQAFLGQRHILVTSWARSAVYDVDFGSGPLRYVDGVMPSMDGIVVIKEAPNPAGDMESRKNTSWTDNGVDVDVHILRKDMERLLHDPLLLPVCN